MAKRKRVDLIGKAYMSGHNLVFTIPKDVIDKMDIKPGDHIRVRIDKVR
jgi:antitoxin component of MazEF toxin-antitoxin module